MQNPPSDNSNIFLRAAQPELFHPSFCGTIYQRCAKQSRDPCRTLRSIIAISSGYMRCRRSVQNHLEICAARDLCKTIRPMCANLKSSSDLCKTIWRSMQNHPEIRAKPRGYLCRTMRRSIAEPILRSVQNHAEICALPIPRSVQNHPSVPTCAKPFPSKRREPDGSKL